MLIIIIINENHNVSLTKENHCFTILPNNANETVDKNNKKRKIGSFITILPKSTPKTHIILHPG